MLARIQTTLRRLHTEGRFVYRLSHHGLAGDAALCKGLYKPMHVTDQVLSIYAGTRGHLDKVPLAEVHAWELGLFRYVRERRRPLWQKITDTKKFDGETEAELEQAIAEFQAQYAQQRSTATVKA